MRPAECASTTPPGERGEREARIAQIAASVHRERHRAALLGDDDTPDALATWDALCRLEQMLRQRRR